MSNFVLGSLQFFKLVGGLLKPLKAENFKVRLE